MDFLDTLLLLTFLCFPQNAIGYIRNNSTNLLGITTRTYKNNTLANLLERTTNTQYDEYPNFRNSYIAEFPADSCVDRIAEVVPDCSDWHGPKHTYDRKKHDIILVGLDDVAPDGWTLTVQIGSWIWYINRGDLSATGWDTKLFDFFFIVPKSEMSSVVVSATKSPDPGVWWYPCLRTVGILDYIDVLDDQAKFLAFKTSRQTFRDTLNSWQSAGTNPVYMDETFGIRHFNLLAMSYCVGLQDAEAFTDCYLDVAGTSITDRGPLQEQSKHNGAFYPHRPGRPTYIGDLGLWNFRADSHSGSRWCLTCSKLDEETRFSFIKLLQIVAQAVGIIGTALTGDIPAVILATAGTITDSLLLAGVIGRSDQEIVEAVKDIGGASIKTLTSDQARLLGQKWVDELRTQGKPIHFKTAQQILNLNREHI
ncbi:hypothetical protein CRV24_009588 [Beauveria bassiana]|nr:hypothetical protein CRV24_009588 [Beauveria bassiana]